MLARFQEGLPLVKGHAHAIARRVGPGCTLDDLRALGREGLLDAARSFNESRGVPFERWASLRIRNAMIDGVRRWGAAPFRARQRLQASSQNHVAKDHAEGRSQERDSMERMQAPRRAALEDNEATASPRDGIGSFGQTPEDALAKAAHRSPTQRSGKRSRTCARRRESPCAAASTASRSTSRAQ
ncbi:MAG: hypothetical protein M3O50_17890 [Myxococcota bacterium]|nr:hypothetical protein [Myxococcota bacterium]